MNLEISDSCVFPLLSNYDHMKVPIAVAKCASQSSKFLLGIASVCWLVETFSSVWLCSGQ